jgi:hypothetical protein
MVTPPIKPMLSLFGSGGSDSASDWACAVKQLVNITTKHTSSALYKFSMAVVFKKKCLKMVAG